MVTTSGGGETVLSNTEFEGGSKGVSVRPTSNRPKSEDFSIPRNTSGLFSRRSLSDASFYSQFLSLLVALQHLSKMLLSTRINKYK